MRIASVACSFPETIVTNNDIFEKVKKHSQAYLTEREMKQVLNVTNHLLSLSGTEKRRLRNEKENAIDFIKKTAANALEKASMKASDIDLVVYASIGRGWLMPGMSTVFLDELGLCNATCFDVIDACQGWMRALHVCYNLILNNVYKNVMIINAEFTMHEYANFALKSIDELEYRFQEFTIGECAAVTILTADSNNEEPYFEFKSNAKLHKLGKIPLPNISQFSYNEKCPDLQPLIAFSYSDVLLDYMKKEIPEMYYNSPELKKREVDICLCHPSVNPLQGSGIADLIGMKDKVISTYAEHGNVSAATIPVLMYSALEQGKLERGMKMMMIVGSIGASYGFAHMSY